MEYDILHRPSYALACIHLEPGEEIQAEPGAMISMSGGIRMTAGVRGGLFRGLRRRMLGGEGFLLNTFTADNYGEVTLAPHYNGDVQEIELVDDVVMAQSGAFLAATPGVRVDAAWGGAKTFFTREGLYLLRCSGRGVLFLSSYGAIHLVELGVGDKYSVDTGHMVAFDEGVDYSLGRSGGLFTTVAGGEGLVAKLEGPGRVYMQTRSEDHYMKWLMARMPRKR